MDEDQRIFENGCSCVIVAGLLIFLLMGILKQFGCEMR
jgi:hypothetical protein